MTHEFRVAQHRRMMQSFGIEITRDGCNHLGDVRAKQARKLRIKARAGSARHRGWRLDYLNTARAFYALARRQALICAWCNFLLREGSTPASHGICGTCDAKHFPRKEAE